MRFIENVSQETISMLQRIYKHSKHHRARQRAHCLLLSFQRHTTTELVEIFQVDRMTIYHWFHAWESRRLAGLYDQAKQGRPPKCTPEQKAHIGQWAKAFPKNLNKISVLVAEHFDLRLSKQTLKRIFIGKYLSRIRKFDQVIAPQERFEAQLRAPRLSITFGMSTLGMTRQIRDGRFQRDIEPCDVPGLQGLDNPA